MRAQGSNPAATNSTSAASFHGWRLFSLRAYNLDDLTCPLCRGAVEVIQHDREPDGTFQSVKMKSRFCADDYPERRADDDENTSDDLPSPSSFFLNPSWMDIPDVSRAMALLSLWQWEALMSATRCRRPFGIHVLSLSVVYTIEAAGQRYPTSHKAEIFAVGFRNGPFYVFLKQSLRLKISQSGVTTRSKLIRRLQMIEHRYGNLEHVTADTNDESIRELERTQRVAQRLWRKWLLDIARKKCGVQSLS